MNEFKISLTNLEYNQGEREVWYNKLRGDLVFEVCGDQLIYEDELILNYCTDFFLAYKETTRLGKVIPNKFQLSDPNAVENFHFMKASNNCFSVSHADLDSKDRKVSFESVNSEVLALIYTAVSFLKTKDLDAFYEASERLFSLRGLNT